MTVAHRMNQIELRRELESLAADCVETAKEAMTLANAETTAECAEARAWLSMAHRIRHSTRLVT